MSAVLVLPDVQRRLVDAAIQLLAEAGPSEIKARSVATKAGVSTMGVYSYFGGVPELLQAVADEGFRQQADYFRRSHLSDNPMTNLCAMALACRTFAHDNPHLYDLMFGLSIKGRYCESRGTSKEPAATQPSTAFQQSYEFLHGQCRMLIEMGVISETDPTGVAAQFWSALHGFIMLELGGHFAGTADPAQDVLIPMCIHLVVGLGAKANKAKKSANEATSLWSTWKADASNSASEGGI